MTTGEAITLVGMVLGSGLLGTALTVWIKRKREPLEQDSLVLANANQSLTIARGMQKDMQDEMGRMRAELKEQRAKADAQEVRLDELSKDLDAERRERVRLGKRVEMLTELNNSDRAWMTRTVARVHAKYPQAWIALLPLPEHITDPGMPALPRSPGPADDGQPDNILQEGTHGPP